MSNCKYRDTEYFKNFTKDSKRKALSFSHIDVSILNKIFDDLSKLNASFDILALQNLELRKIEHTPTEASAGGIRLHISNRLSYQRRNDLRLSDPGKMESTFIEIICLKSINVIAGCIYKHPTLPISDFISSLLPKLQKESSRRIFLLGDFNIDSLRDEILDSINNFNDTLSSKFLLPLILLPRRFSKTSTLIDNIFKTQLL